MEIADQENVIAFVPERINEQWENAKEDKKTFNWVNINYSYLILRSPDFSTNSTLEKNVSYLRQSRHTVF